ncbi:hypothetical protein [Enterococcus sp. SMC-9]|uniref:hypothetical protein n=1 Tax=Enterococcus sp. SMC-9 TaxID=2862343 RepID=UPI001E45701B|nr:hypothetical protein [Enterococcus sp. SMC-9]MCD1023461.1 hypothetical protein [Enterococcus sp. SMC-9]
MEIRRLRPTEFGITPESYLLKGFTKNENSYKIGGITVRIGEEETDVLKVGTTTGSQIELENKVMTQTLLNQMWELVKSINYFPFELKWRGCPPLEAGDWIYVTDRNGKQYSVPNLSYSMNFNGGLSAESKATTNSVSGNATKYRGTLNQKVQWLESILSSNDWNHNYYDAEPENPKVGDLWFKKVGKDIEIWQYVETDGVQDWELQISSAPNQELLDMIEDLVKETAEAQAAAEEAKAAGEAAEQLAEEAKTESAKAIEDANAAVAGVTNLGQIVQAVDQAAQLAIEQSANAVTDAQAAMVKANDILGTVTELEGTITNITADIDAINGELSVKVDQTTFNQLKGTVDTHSTSISANAQAITQKANQTQVNAIDQTVISHTAELTTQYDKIAGLVTKTDGQSTKISALELQAGQFNLTLSSVQQDVASIEVGGRNYFLNSTTELTGSREFVNSPAWDMAPLIDKYGLDQHYTISFDLKSKISGYINVYSQNGSGTRYDIGITTINATTEYKRYSVTFKPKNSNMSLSQALLAFYGTYDSGRIPTIKNVKFELGNKATDWTPAPEDMATVTALTSVQATVDGLVTTVATKANQSQVTQLADQITSVVTDLNILENGTRNLLRGSSRFDYGVSLSLAARVISAPTFLGNYTIEIDEPGSGYADTISWRTTTQMSGNQYTLSFWAKASGASKVLRAYLYNPNSVTKTETSTGYIGAGSDGQAVFNLTTEWKKYWVKWTQTPSNSVKTVILGRIYNAGGGTFSFSSPILVEGSIIPDWTPAPEDLATASQITQLSDQINLRVQKGEVINQINLSTEGVLIAGEKVWITGLTKIDNAVIATANIKDLAVTNAKIANLAVNTAKIGDAAIVTAKIGDLAVTNAKIANLAINDAKIQNASISSAKIINLDASKVVANTLSAITTNTGTLNVSGWLNMTTDNLGLRGTFDFGDPYQGAYNFRWYDGDMRISHRHMYLNGGLYNVNSNQTKGSWIADYETFYGPDYAKFRTAAKNGNLKNRVDITSDAITMGTAYENSNIQLFSDGTSFFRNDMQTLGNISIASDKALKAFIIQALDASTNIYFNAGRTELADFRVGKDGSTLNGGRVVQSKAVYNRTYSSAANMIITADGILGRSTSARKYKADIQTANDVINKAKKVLDLSPASWWDKGELADGVAKERYYGFIADDFAAKELTEVVIYENGEIESLAYDRISMYHNVILTEHEQEINKLKKKVETLENEIRVLQVA